MHLSGKGDRDERGRIALLVVGVVLAVIGFGIAAGGAALLWAQAAERDADGSCISGTYSLATTRYALTTGEIDLDVRRGPGGHGLGAWTSAWR